MTMQAQANICVWIHFILPPMPEKITTFGMSWNRTQIGRPPLRAMARTT